MPHSHVPAPEAGRPLLYHHCRSVEHVAHDIVVPFRVTQHAPPPTCVADGAACDWQDAWHHAVHLEPSYRWLAEQTGFWPLFLAVGASDDDRRLTGYQCQWSRSPYWGPDGPPRNLVLFSWRDAPRGLVHVCYEHWYVVLNAPAEPGPDPMERHPQRHGTLKVSPTVRSWVLHPSWRSTDWLRRARRQPASVQAVCPLLDLSTADVVWCRNRATRERLVRMGFRRERVVVRRLAIS